VLDGHVLLGARQVEATPGSHRLEVSQLRAVAQVVARREMRTVGREHDHLDGVVARSAVEGAVQLVEHAFVLRVAYLGAREHDAGRS